MRFIVLLITALCFTAPLHAHQQKAAFTQVLLNERTGLLEVAHRFWLHDAEHAVQLLFDRHADIIDDAKTQQRFAEYVTARFAIKESNGQPLALHFVGVEIDRSFIWVYQESLPPTSKRLTLSHQALLDIWNGQENMVNVEGMGELQTVFFEAHQTETTIDLE